MNLEKSGNNNLGLFLDILPSTLSTLLYQEVEEKSERAGRERKRLQQVSIVILPHLHLYFTAGKYHHPLSISGTVLERSGGRYNLEA